MCSHSPVEFDRPRFFIVRGSAYGFCEFRALVRLACLSEASGRCYLSLSLLLSLFTPDRAPTLSLLFPVAAGMRRKE